MLWSILVPSIPERYHSAHALLYSLLETQGVALLPDVELLYFLDTRRRSVGAKRNALLDLAQGEYLSFIDDDDEVAPDYVQKIRQAILSTRSLPSRPDVITYPQHCTLAPSGVVHACTYSLAHWRDRPPDARRVLQHTDQPNVLAWSGPPAHTMTWRSEVAKAARFPDKNFGEDVSWVDQVCAAAKVELTLNGSPMYFYRFDEAKTATR